MEIDDESEIDKDHEYDTLFECNNSCVEDNKTATNGQSPDTKNAKFNAPIRKHCSICGVWVHNTHEWITHHLSTPHRKSICYLSYFRAKCIDRRDEHGNVVYPDNMERIAEDIHYTQELFQMSGGSTFICVVCGSGVYDVNDHLTSLKHNESYMNVLYPDQLPAIKESCIRATGVDWDAYEKSILKCLQEKQPKNKSPLDIYALEDDSDFNDWIWKCMMAFSAYTQSRDETSKISAVLSACVSQDVLNKRKEDEMALCKTDFCLICRTKLFSSDSASKHNSSKAHENKVKLLDFFCDSNQYKLILSQSSVQSSIDKYQEPLLGPETIVELIDKSADRRAWSCLTCFTLNENCVKIIDHLAGVKHMLNYLGINYPDVKITSKSGKGMNEELKRLAHEVTLRQERGKVQVAELVDIELEKLFEVCGQKLTALKETDVTNGTEPVVMEEEIQILFSDREEDMLWCETCHNLILVNKNVSDAKRIWEEHCQTQAHREKKETRKEFVFDAKNFVDEKPPVEIRVVLNQHNLTLLGLDHIIKRTTKVDDGVVIDDVVCLLCGQKFNTNAFATHVQSRAHILQYLHKNQQPIMREILKKPEDRERIIHDFLMRKPARKNIRVYNPLRAEYLAAEYERLRKQIAEKERLLEEKRKQKIEEAKQDLTKKRAAEEENKKQIEMRRVAELEKIQKIKKEEEEKQARLMANISKMKEKQDEERKRMLEQQRLLQRLQEEKQKKKEEDLKRIEEKRKQDMRRQMEEKKRQDEKRAEENKKLEQQRAALEKSIKEKQANLNKEKDAKAKAKQAAQTDKNTSQRGAPYGKQSQPSQPAILASGQKNQTQPSRPTAPSTTRPSTMRPPVSSATRPPVPPATTRPPTSSSTRPPAPSATRPPTTPTTTRPPTPSTTRPSVISATRPPTAPTEPKWKPMAPNGQTVVRASQLSSSSQSKNMPEKAKVESDVLTELLKNSTLLPIHAPLNAYIHPLLIGCPEALIGLEHVAEFECMDDLHEPGYFCRLCLYRCLAKDLIKHVVSADHRMKYLENSYTHLHNSVVNNYSDRDGTRNAVLKQYATQIEKSEGRKRIEYRLTMKVSNGVLVTKKPSVFCTPNLYDGDPSSSLAPYAPPTPDVAPPGVVMPPFNPYFSPNMFHVPPPTFVPRPVPPPTITNAVASRTTLLPPPLPPLPPSTAAAAPMPPSIQEVEMKDSTEWDWDNKCSKFLRKLTSNDDPTAKITYPSMSKANNKSVAPTPASNKKAGGSDAPRSTVDAKTAAKSASTNQKSTPPNQKTTPPNSTLKHVVDAAIVACDKRDGGGSRKRSRSRSRRRNRSRSRSSKRQRRRHSSSSSSSDERRRRRGRRHSRSTSSRRRDGTRRSHSGRQSRDRSKKRSDSAEKTMAVERKRPLTPEETVSRIPPASVVKKPVAEAAVNKKSSTPPARSSSPVLSENEIVMLERMAHENPAALEKLMCENPKIYRALLAHLAREKESVEKLEQKREEKATKPPPPMPASQQRRRPDEPPIAASPFKKSGPVFASASPEIANRPLSFSRQPQQQPLSAMANIASKDSTDKMSLLADLLKATRQENVAAAGASSLASSLSNLLTSSGGAAGALSAESLLLQMLADEEEKKRKQAEQGRMLYDLLRQVSEVTGQVIGNQSGNKQVYDYSHGGGGGGGAAGGKTVSLSLGKKSEIDSLISEASLNVQQEQNGRDANRGRDATGGRDRDVIMDTINDSLLNRHANKDLYNVAPPAAVKYRTKRQEERARRDAIEKAAKLINKRCGMTGDYDDDYAREGDGRSDYRDLTRRENRAPMTSSTTTGLSKTMTSSTKQMTPLLTGSSKMVTPSPLDLQAQLASKYERNRQERAQELERYRKEALEKIARDLCAPTSSSKRATPATAAAASFFGQDVDRMDDIDKILSLAKAQSAQATGQQGQRAQQQRSFPSTSGNPYGQQQQPPQNLGGLDLSKLPPHLAALLTKNPTRPH